MPPTMIKIIKFAIEIMLIVINYTAIVSSRAASTTNWTQINEICGVSYAERIIGGTNARLSQYPWLAHLGILRKFDLPLDLSARIAITNYIRFHGFA